MKPYLRMLVPILIAIIVVASIAMWASRTIATRHTMPKPPSYPLDEIQKIAEEQFPIVIQALGRSPEMYGFKNQDELSRAELGGSFIGYGIDVADVPTDNALKGNIRDRLEGGVTVTFPILVDDHVRAAMDIEYRDGVWQRGMFGGTGPQWELAIAAKQRLSAQGITGRLDVVMFKAGASIFGMVDAQGQTYLIPLSDAGKLFPELDFGGQQMYTFQEVLPLMRVQAQRIVTEVERQNQENLLRMPSPPPTLTPAPTATPEPAYPAPVLEPTAITAP